jgi:hypothetical protein
MKPFKPSRRSKVPTRRRGTGATCSLPRRQPLKKIAKSWMGRPGVKIYPDGRERINRATHDGRVEYRIRTDLMWVRQGGLCCNCKKPLGPIEACFEHERGRNAKYRDDRIWDSNRQPINGASHLLCNQERGSRRTPIWKGEM